MLRACLLSFLVGLIRDIYYIMLRLHLISRKSSLLVVIVSNDNIYSTSIQISEHWHSFSLCTWLHLARIDVFIITQWNRWMARHGVHWQKVLHVRAVWWTAQERPSSYYTEYEISDMNLERPWIIMCKYYESACNTMHFVPKILVFWLQGTKLALDLMDRDTKKKLPKMQERGGNIFVSA